MMLGLEIVADNVMSIDNILLIVMLAGSLIFFARDFRLGAVLLFVMSAALFMLDYAFRLEGWDWTKPLIVCLISLVILAFTMMFGLQESAQSGMI